MRLLGLSLFAALVLGGSLIFGGLERSQKASLQADPLPKQSSPELPPNAVIEKEQIEAQSEPEVEAVAEPVSEVERMPEPAELVQETDDQPDERAVRLAMERQYASQLTDTDQPNTCGPTALYMVLDYFDVEDSLERAIDKHRYPAEQGGYDPQCWANPICTSPGVLARVAREEYGLAVAEREGWTFDEVRQSLAAGRPVIADIVWRLGDGGLGHFVVIYGIDADRQTVTYHDPYDGAAIEASWDNFAAAWDGPVDPGDPLRPEGHRLWAMEIGIE